jgi:hypothetical protein
MQVSGHSIIWWGVRASARFGKAAGSALTRLPEGGRSNFVAARLRQDGKSQRGSPGIRGMPARLRNDDIEAGNKTLVRIGVARH